MLMRLFQRRKNNIYHQTKVGTALIEYGGNNKKENNHEKTYGGNCRTNEGNPIIN